MKKEVKDDRYNKTFAYWVIVILIIGPSALVSSCIAGVLTKDNMFSVYFELLISNWLVCGGVSIWILGCFLIQGKFLFSKGKYKYAFRCFLIFAVLAAMIAKSLVNGLLYKKIICYAKDLPYAEKNLYYEKVEKLNGIDKSESVGKSNYMTISLTTENDTYQLMSNIVTRHTYKQFRSNFKKGDKVKIKYLPNTKFIVSVEALKD